MCWRPQQWLLCYYIVLYNLLCGLNGRSVLVMELSNKILKKEIIIHRFAIHETQYIVIFKIMLECIIFLYAQWMKIM